MNMNDPDLRKKKAWSVSGLLTIAQNKGVKLAADFEKSGPYTLQFTRQFPTPIAAGISVYTLAEIIWSVEGNSHRRLISVDSGIAISGNAQGVTAQIYDWTNLAVAAANQIDYNIFATCVEGLRGSNVQRPLLEIGGVNPNTRGQIQTQDIAAGVAVNFPVPRNAGINSFRVNLSSNTAVPVFSNGIFVACTDSSGVIPVRQRNITSSNDALLLNWEPLPPGAENILIFNVAGNTVIKVSISWGIEG